MAGNPFFDISVEEGRLLAESKADSEKKSERIIPFGMVRATGGDWREKVDSDTAFRKSELQRLGYEAFLKRMGKET